MTDLSKLNILMLATNGFEQSELFEPRQALLDAGAQVTLASIDTDPIRGVTQDETPPRPITPDLTLDQVDVDAYDALVLPGGVANPDRLRTEDRAIEIVEMFCQDEKPVAAICHAPWLLIEADVVEGRRVTSWPSLRTDLSNAGGNVVDAEVVVDGNLITSRNPGDIPAFNRTIIEMLARVGAEPG